MPEPAVEPAAVAESSQAASGDASGPGDAESPSGQCTLIPAGESQWYTFQYTGHHQFEQPKDEDDEEKAIWIPSLVEI